MSFGKVITLNTGATIPQLGFGTWQSQPKEVETAVEIAVKAGYRHLDLAIVYGNQVEVGAALKKVIPSVVKREELFITSKLWNASHQPAEVEKELDLTLSQLGIDYLDLYLVHWPVAFAPGDNLFPQSPDKPGWAVLDAETTLVDTWKAVIALPKSKVRSVGVSNFNATAIQALIDATGVTPAVNQIEAHPLLPQDELVKYHKQKNIHITAYSPLGNNSAGKPLLTEHKVVKEVAEKLSSTPAQVLLAWAVKRGIVSFRRASMKLASSPISNKWSCQLKITGKSALLALGTTPDSTSHTCMIFAGILISSTSPRRRKRPTRSKFNKRLGHIYTGSAGYYLDHCCSKCVYRSSRELTTCSIPVNHLSRS
ncbi:NADP-dependent oxidoreductase domain-containing protein [Cantharellus anzutake]|uniref:NADP-dependent oxidoreductase domain-containing protein n=1 Tax=Cantharellus anzutake TaxID=1750568 RepID=UPI0019088191|nr:NADP-dependent oxidoreductase domain-containing protein [Cantharellus anzutake]KAF8343086.1 NADP-dependent oxidoreductase domain-containing protein [Cantharellus anzutake]